MQFFILIEISWVHRWRMKILNREPIELHPPMSPPCGSICLPLSRTSITYLIPTCSPRGYGRRRRGKGGRKPGGSCSRCCRGDCWRRGTSSDRSRSWSSCRRSSRWRPGQGSTEVRSWHAPILTSFSPSGPTRLPSWVFSYASWFYRGPSRLLSGSEWTPVLSSFGGWCWACTTVPSGNIMLRVCISFVTTQGVWCHVAPQWCHHWASTLLLTWYSTAPTRCLLPRHLSPPCPTGHPSDAPSPGWYLLPT